MRAVNLIPAEQRSSAALGAGRSEGAAYAVLALLLGIALLAFLYGRADHQVSSRSSEAAKLSAQAQRAQTQASALAPYTSFAALREQRMQAVSSLVDSRFDWAHAVHEFGRVLPPGVSVTSLSGEIASTAGAGSSSSSSAASTATASSGASSSKSATVTSVTPPGSVPQFTIVGCAVSQPIVAVMLERLRLMDGASAVTLQSSAKSASGGGSGGCPSGDPQFSAQVTFQGLPTPAATHAAVVSATSSSKGGAK